MRMLLKVRRGRFAWNMYQCRATRSSVDMDVKSKIYMPRLALARSHRSKTRMHSGVASWPRRTYPSSLRFTTASPDFNSAEMNTLRISVPFSALGLVIGPEGSTINSIQRQTQTRIVIHGNDKDSVFEVTGLQENTKRAKEKIQSIIVSSMVSERGDGNNDFARNVSLAGSVVNFDQAFYHTSGMNISRGNSYKSMYSKAPASRNEDNFCKMRSASASRVCLMCEKKRINAAIVPCGHYRFCYECAKTAALSYQECPFCKERALMAVMVKF